MIERTKENGKQSNTTLQQLYGQKKKAARRAVEKAKREMEEKVRGGLRNEVDIEDGTREG